MFIPFPNFGFPSEDPEEPENSDFLLSEVNFGNDSVDLTGWLCSYVRVQLAEHFSALYDKVDPATIPIIIALTLKGMNDAETGFTKNGTPEPPTNL